MNTLNQNILSKYIKDHKHPIDETLIFNWQPETNKENTQTYYLAIEHIENDNSKFINQEQYCQLKTKFLQQFSAFSSYMSTVKITSNQPYSLIAIYITDEFAKITKLIIDSISFNNEEPEIKYKQLSSHLIFFESLDVVFKRGNYHTPLRLGFAGIGHLNMNESLFKDLPLFYQINDFERNKIQEYATTLTYGDLLCAQRDGLSRKEILQKHLKKAKDLNGIINFNKFSVTESYMLVKIVTEFDDKTFYRFVEWFKNKGRFIKLECRHTFKTQRLELITLFILDSIGETLNLNYADIELDNYHMARDWVLMCRSRRRKLKVDFKSPNGLKRRHDKLVESIKAKKDKQHKMPFEVHDHFKPLIKILKTPKNGYIYLDSPHALSKEGNKMGHCVSLYTHYVKKGDCIIAATTIDDVRYTLEIAAIIKNHKLEGYSLEQMQSKYNGGIKKTKPQSKSY